MAVAQKSSKDGDPDADVRLPPVADGERGTVLAVTILEKKTKPPSPYTEGTLVSDMEGAGKYVEDAQLRKILKNVSGLGTSATRAAIVENLKERELLERKGKTILSTPKGKSLIAFLPGEFHDIAKTARWEAQLELISKQGNGKAFEKFIADEVTRQVTILQEHRPMDRVAPVKPGSKEKRPMSNGPSEKMLQFAKNIAEKLGEPLPDDVTESFEKCKEYIDANKDRGGPPTFKPSEKQVKFAESIAKAKGTKLPANLLADAKQLSAWIDANKDGLPQMAFTPSAKQISFAESIATKKGKEIPAAARKDAKQLSAWIDANK